MTQIKTTIFLLLISANCFAQKVLTIGDTLPAIQLSNIINHPQKEINTKDLRGKLVILDFWATWCKACIEAMPHLDSLQQKFSNSIQVIMVTDAKKEAIQSFFKKRKDSLPPHIPVICNDTLLAKLFPHTFKPHHVWIDGNGLVRQITNGWNTTEENISRFLSDHQYRLTEKKDIMDYNYSKPMIAEGDGRWLDKMEYYSYLAHAIPGISIGYKNETAHIVRSNASLLELLKTAFAENGKYDFTAANTILLNVKDSFPFYVPADANRKDEWIKKHLYNYELKIPQEKTEELYRTMQADLLRYFSYEIRIEKRKIPCLVLVKTPGKNILCSQLKKSATNMWVQTESPVLYMFNLPFEQLYRKLSFIVNNRAPQYPFINETGITQNIDIMVSAEAFQNKTLDCLREELRQYGLDIIEKKLYREVLVITKRTKE